MFKSFKDMRYIQGGALRSIEDQKNKSTRKAREVRRKRRTHLQRRTQRQNFRGRMLVYFSLHLNVKVLFTSSLGLVLCNRTLVKNFGRNLLSTLFKVLRFHLSRKDRGRGCENTHTYTVRLSHESCLL